MQQRWRIIKLVWAATEPVCLCVDQERPAASSSALVNMRVTRTAYRVAVRDSCHRRALYYLYSICNIPKTWVHETVAAGAGISRHERGSGSAGR
ncbi:unnamed protein product [Chrysodeixis includens]|uniref:Secreted protein n=1 Tax=Chrysodeixis includens TaxID=689277 RepID=A0A9N8KX45_CHRIL|nr:unnamed protein product [Chrysodeixis includens]